MARILKVKTLAAEMSAVAQTLRVRTLAVEMSAVAQTLKVQTLAAEMSADQTDLVDWKAVEVAHLKLVVQAVLQRATC